MTLPDSDFAVFDEEDAAAQCAGVLSLLPPGATVADLGAGHGRIAIPLARRGASVLAVDRSLEALEFEGWTSRQRGITPLHEDFLEAEPAWAGQGPLDLVCCLGNTLSLLLEESQVKHLFALAFRAQHVEGTPQVRQPPPKKRRKMCSGSLPGIGSILLDVPKSKPWRSKIHPEGLLGPFQTTNHKSTSETLHRCPKGTVADNFENE